jgi:hypothetical protein
MFQLVLHNTSTFLFWIVLSNEAIFLKHLAAVSHTLWGNFEILRSHMDIFAKKKDTS